ncbi:T9SS type A sorting domain-containing protein [Rubrivirga sp.]|uniref:T9SS type A sorting domain-containing protein n=1 Tax=Rubrivirga sp. TaxID=1885344 RepID=UPI003B51F1BD
MTHLLRLLSLSFALVATASAQGLNVYLAASSDALGAGDEIDYTVMVSNTGSSTLENVRVEVRLPEQVAQFTTGAVVGGGLDCGNGVCSSGETVVWSLGALDPGDNRRLTYPTLIRTSPPDGDATTVVVASADAASDIILTHDVAIDPTPLLRLSLVPDPSPAAPGEPFSYTLTYGNVGNASPSGVTLTMPVPEGTSFQSATEGGFETDGVVTWSLGTVGVGAGGRVEVTVVPNASLSPGATLVAEAALDSGETTELVVSSEALTEVGARDALRFDFALSQNALTRSGPFAYTLTATNVSTTDELSGVTVDIRLPNQIAQFTTGNAVGYGFDCGNGVCSPGETVSWNVGTLARGQSRTLILPSAVADGAQQGQVLRALYYAAADGLNEQAGGADLVVDPSPVTGLRLVPSPGPVAPGETVTYTLLFGNVGFQTADLTLRLALPEGTTFVSATGGGTESDGTVTWEASAVATEAVGRLQATVEVDTSLPAGQILRAGAELDTGSATEYVVYSSAATSLRSGVPLRVAYTTDIDAGEPGDPVEFTLVAENTGASDLTDVIVEFRLPEQAAQFTTGAVVGSGLDCGNGVCSSGETVFWDVTTLAPGQSRTIVLPTSIRSNASPGQFLLSPVVAWATGSNEVVLYNGVLLGEEIMFPSTAADDAPESGLRVTLAPNPTAGPTRFLVSQPAAGRARLAVYDALGREVAVVLDAPQPAGEHAVTWDAAGLPSGIYLYRLTVGDAVRTGAVTVVR